MADSNFVKEFNNDKGQPIGIKIDGYLWAEKGLILVAPSGKKFIIRVVNDAGDVQTEEVTEINAA